MARWVLLLVCALSFVAQQQAPVFRGGVDLVTVGVTVVDRTGQPIKGLTADDFVVSINGKKRSVRALEFLEFGATPTPAAETPPRLPGGAARPAPSRGGRVILIVVDDLSAKPAQMMALRASAQRMLDTLELGDLVGVATTSGLGPAISPTRDRAVVKAALASTEIAGRYDDHTGQYYVSIPEAIEINRRVALSFAPDRGYSLEVQSTFADVVRRECMDMVAAPKGDGADDGPCATRIVTTAAQLGKNLATRAAAQLSAYKRLIEALAPAPAPRVIVALSAGIAVGVDQTALTDLDPIGVAAAKAGVQLYALTEAVDPSDAGERGFQRDAARRAEHAFLVSGVQTVAHAAGGEAFTVVGQPDRFFARIAAETSGLYQLGVEASAETPAGEFVDVKVAVTRPGAIVRIKARALASTAAPKPASIDEQLQQRLAQGGAAVGVPLTISTLVRRNPLYADRLQLAVNLGVPETVAGPVLMMFAVIDEQGLVVENGRKLIAVPPAGLDYEASAPVSITRGRYRLRVAAADSAGNIGSVEEPLHVALAHVDNYGVSSLFTSIDTTRLRATLELYPDDAAAPTAIAVRLALIEEGGIDPIVEADVTPTGAGAIRVVTASLPVDQLGAGIYTIRATVLNRAGDAAGTVSTTVRKR